MTMFTRSSLSAILLAATLAVSVCACDQNQKTDGDAEEATEQTTESSGTEAGTETEDGESADETGTEPEDGAKTGATTSDVPPGTSPKSAGSTASKPSLKPGTKKQKKLLSKAKKAFLSDDFRAAEPIFKKVLDQGPMTGTKMSAYIALAEIYLELGEAGKAIELLERIPEPGKQVVEVRLMLARAYASRDELREAVDEYAKVLELQPNYLFAYPPLGALYAEMGEKKKAAELYLQYENRLTELTRTLEKPDQSKAVNRINILDILASSSDQRVVDAVLTALSDPKPRVRAKAAHTAAELKAITAKSTLKKMVDNDEDKYVRKAAASALQRLKKVKTPPERETVDKDDFQSDK
ncbi:MAG: HEAT repeat domain-containing protein [Bradymonadaceae bacterium]